MQLPLLPDCKDITFMEALYAAGGANAMVRRCWRLFGRPGMGLRCKSGVSALLPW